jgi:hypothetical protein
MCQFGHTLQAVQARFIYCKKLVFASAFLSVSPTAWNNLAPTGRNLMTFDISAFFEKLVEKIQVQLKYDKNNGHFTSVGFYIYDNISLNYS